MMIQSQALGIVAEPINIITLVTENKTASLDNQLVALLPEAFNSGFASAMLTAGLSCFITLFIMLFPCKEKQGALSQQIAD